MKTKTLLNSIAKILAVALLFTTNLWGESKKYVITSYGAIADGITNNANAIQVAIDLASNAGGGTVVIPAGNFASGTIYLRSNVELNLELGARLLGSTDRNDYGDSVALALITAKNQKNISITGRGVIDGQAPELVKNIFSLLNEEKITDPQWRFKRPTEAIRPMLIHIIMCENVTVSGVTVKNSASWVQNYSKCTNLVIDNIKVESTAYWNNDGIDISDSKNVRVTNCNVNAADDGICLKSEDPAALCEDVYIADCTIRSSASAFKLGTASKGGFKNVKVRNLTIFDTYRSAVALECVDGGVLENIDIQNITAKNTGNALFIRLGRRNEQGETSRINGIRIADLKAEVPLRKPDLGYPFEGPPDHMRGQYLRSLKNRPNLGYPFTGQPNYPYNLIPSSIIGIPGAYVKDVTLENIEIVFEGTGSKKIAYIPLDSLQLVPEKITDYPEFSMFGELPAWGIYVRHADGVVMKNVKLSYKEFDFRPALVFDDAKNVELNEVEIPTGEEIPVIMFNNSGKKTIKNIKLPFELNKAIQEQ